MDIPIKNLGGMFFRVTILGLFFHKCFDIESVFEIREITEYFSVCEWLWSGNEFKSFTQYLLSMYVRFEGVGHIVNTFDFNSII